LVAKKHSYSHTNLIRELRSEPDDFRNYLRMDKTTYRNLLSLVALIMKVNTVMKRTITSHE